jgi:hypothetical protein
VIDLSQGSVVRLRVKPFFTSPACGYTTPPLPYPAWWIGPRGVARPRRTMDDRHSSGRLPT